MKLNNGYTNLANLPHLLRIENRKTNQLLFAKKFKTEAAAINYLHEARDFKDNKKRFRFIISGPNMLYIT